MSSSACERGKMQIRDWHEFYDTLTILEGTGEPVPKPTDAQLNGFESESGFRLPKSYRAYITVFGAGEFPCILRIAAPGNAETNPNTDLSTTSRRYGYTNAEIEGSGLPADQRDRLRRLFYFGLERGRQWLGWDPGDVRDAVASEYAIYRVDSLEDGAELVATSFRQLIEETCEVIFAPDPDYEEASMGPQRAYQPAMRLPKNQ
jgi:hypothetical protein